jgi:CRP/FNR family transcriptional regulator
VTDEKDSAKLSDKPDWASEFLQLSGLEPDSWSLLARKANRERVAAGGTVFREGDPCGAYVLLKSGRIKVVKQWADGRATSLYRIVSGCSCTTSTALLIVHGSYSADAVAETDCELLLLPRRDFLELFDRSAEFRRQVCREFGSRLAQLTRRLEAALFRPVDARLADWLIEHRSEDGSVAVTHQDLAMELGSAREVITRHLNQLKATGCVKLSRGVIRVVDETHLLGIAAPTPEAYVEPDATGDPLAPSRVPLHSVDPAQWTRDMGPLSEIDDDVWRYVASRAQVVDVPAGARPFSAGDPCGHYIIVKEGAVRVFASLHSGRDFLLYRLGPGEACCATASGVLRQEEHVTSAITEEDSVAVLISDRDFHRAFHESDGFREYVVGSYEARIQQLLDLLGTLLVENVEVRLARCILRRAAIGSPLKVSHEELASEVGTAREVVSRNLKTWERDGSVRLGRRSVELLDDTHLVRLTSTRALESDFVTESG